MGRVRARAERDAVTVEMVFAAVTGALMAAAGFVAVITPVLCGAFHGEARKGCFTVAVIVAAALFCGRVAITLRRFERQNRLREVDLTPDQPDQPDQPAGPGPAEPSGRPDAVGSGVRVRVPHQRRAAAGGAEGEAGGSPDQPSQPGRTSPDS